MSVQDPTGEMRMLEEGGGSISITYDFQLASWVLTQSYSYLLSKIYINETAINNAVNDIFSKIS